MNEPTAPPRLDRELSDLRARAYGPHPDILDDPEALARLAELESAHLMQHAWAGRGEDESPLLGEDESPAHVQVTPETVVAVEASLIGAAMVSGESARTGSLWRKVTATPSGRVWLIVASVVVVLGVVFAATWSAGPKPEANLRPTGIGPNALILSAISYAPLVEVDRSTLRGYEPYRGVEPWVAEDAEGSRCLLAIWGSSLHGIRCAPQGAELLLDIGAFPLQGRYAYAVGLADGSVIRFQLHGDSVDAYLFTPPEE